MKTSIKKSLAKRKLDKILQPIQSSLDQLENRFIHHIKSDNDLMQNMINYVFEKKGKMLRPSLVFITSKIWEVEDKTKLIDLALSIELIHIATLVHDDVNDKSGLRRGIETFNAKWGNTSSILFGDFLFSKAFTIVSSLENIDVIKNLSQTTSEICEGEIMQSFFKKNYEISLEKYNKIISNKTASLIAESCRIGGTLLSYSKDKMDILNNYGFNLGMAFQVYDDYLDFYGEKEVMGKPVMSDVLNGYMTLPIIHLFDSYNSENEKEDLLRELEYLKSSNDLEKIIGMLQEKDSLKYTLERAKYYIEEAKKNISSLKDMDLKNTLEQIANFVVDREY